MSAIGPDQRLFGVEMTAPPVLNPARGQTGTPMKPTISKTGAAGANAKGGRVTTFAPPTPKVTRQKRAKVLTAAERAAFLASRPDLTGPK
jgi:hypothetical protein